MKSTQTTQSMQLHPVKALLRAGLFAVLFIGSLAIFAPVQAQENAQGLKPGETKTIVKTHTLMDTWKEGGIVMYPLALCSIIVVWLSTDLWMRTAGNKMMPAAYLQQMQDLFRAGDYVGAYQFAKNNPSSGTDVARVALSFIGDGQDATDFALLDGLNKINAAIQTRINYLSVIGVCTPMIGLTGTVIGMKKAFGNLGASGIGDPAGLAESIGEVLVATASGLFIAIPAFMMFYILRNRLQSGLHHTQELLQALFRKMPYQHLKDCHVGEEEFYAATPNWVAGGGAAAPAHA